MTSHQELLERLRDGVSRPMSILERERIADTVEALTRENAALRADKERLRTFAHEATKAITGLTSGGSEYFGGEVDGIYLADLPLCVERIRARFATPKQKIAEAKVERLERFNKKATDDFNKAMDRAEAAERRLAEQEFTLTHDEAKAELDKDNFGAEPASGQGQTQGEAVAWRSIVTAPKDGTMLLLHVCPGASEDDGWTPFADSAEPYVTIGFNALTDTGEDKWQFAGWDWCHDCFTDGAGEVIGWAPLQVIAMPHDEARQRVEKVLNLPSAGCASASELAETIADSLCATPPSPEQGQAQGKAVAFECVCGTGCEIFYSREDAERKAADYEDGEVRQLVYATPPSPEPDAELEREAEAIVEMVKVGNFYHHREIGDLHGWIDRLHERIRRLARHRSRVGK